MLYPFGSRHWPFAWKSICQSAPCVWRNHQSRPAEVLPIGFAECSCNIATLLWGGNMGVKRGWGDSFPPLRTAWVHSVTQRRLYHKGVDPEHLWRGKEKAEARSSLLPPPHTPSHLFSRTQWNEGIGRPSRGCRAPARLIFNLRFNFFFFFPT